MAKIKRRDISAVLTNVKTVRCFGRDDEFLVAVNSSDGWIGGFREDGGG
jgi:hypothetical protein